MSPPLLVVATGWDAESWASRMRRLLPGRTVLCSSPASRLPTSAELAEVAYFLAWKPTQANIDSLPRLKVIFSLGAGVDHILSLSPPDVPVTRVVDADLTSRMTSYVVWQVLHHLRRGAVCARQQRAHLWREWRQPAAEEVTVGILGLGHMGRDAAEVLLRLGFPVRGWSRSLKQVAGVDTFHGEGGLDPFLAGTDILVALLPLTRETTGLINRAMLSKLRQGGPLGGPVLINAGRGGSQVEADLIQALGDGTLAGASLDVFAPEPLAPDSPLWDMENVVITPHLAADSDPSSLAGQIAEQILAFERGEPLRNVVDRRRGY